MNISDLLNQNQQQCHAHDDHNPSFGRTRDLIHENELMVRWSQVLTEGGYHLASGGHQQCRLTDVILESEHAGTRVRTPVHVKVIGRHMNGSFRCHIGMGKLSRPIQSVELRDTMRLMAVFFRPANKTKSQLVSPVFICFPTWLLHLFRYTEHDATPGRTDVRFLENAALAKEDHIFRLNNVINTLFRFNLHEFDHDKLSTAVHLSNYLFDEAGFDYHALPHPHLQHNDPTSTSSSKRLQPPMYAKLLALLHAPRPAKVKPNCLNCSTKPASRRKLCVACYRYELKHHEPRPLRLIVANRFGRRVASPSSPVSPSPPADIPSSSSGHSSNNTGTEVASSNNTKVCANCNVNKTHQWYRNLCGPGHWCETCKSYYLRHSRVRPPELFVKAARRKVDVRQLMDWCTSPSASSSFSAVPTSDESTGEDDMLWQDNSRSPKSLSTNDDRSELSSPSFPPVMTFQQQKHFSPSLQAIFPPLSRFDNYDAHQIGAPYLEQSFAFPDNSDVSSVITPPSF
ncbi:hypothetical protein BCR43DRAFT_481765 [Syncephalastrum racemosum]|uniref:GATA-type domain-containing protein n=1 Tax=Syncephalastrum racemosum TaxID=13706 RepID=A0A1X2HSW2_SYNRA|nr:hypothetical protein BCR43DRAFT_481765 [Syncephalastrum racemosum]